MFSQVLNFVNESSFNVNFLSTFFISKKSLDIFTVSKNQSNQALFSWKFCANTSGIRIHQFTGIDGVSYHSFSVCVSDEKIIKQTKSRELTI